MLWLRTYEILRLIYYTGWVRKSNMIIKKKNKKTLQLVIFFHVLSHTNIHNNPMPVESENRAFSQNLRWRYHKMENQIVKHLSMKWCERDMRAVNLLDLLFYGWWCNTFFIIIHKIIIIEYFILPGRRASCYTQPGQASNDRYLRSIDHQASRRAKYHLSSYIYRRYISIYYTTYII